MYDRRVFQLFLDLRVALEAQVIAFGSEKSLERRTMRIVAGGAAVLHGRMDIGLLHYILQIDMARKAYIGTGFQCLGLVVGLMRIVARGAFASLERLMLRLRLLQLLFEVIVTLEAQLAVRLEQ